MSGEYVHPTDPYDHYDSFLHYAQQLQLLQNVQQSEATQPTSSLVTPANANSSISLPGSSSVTTYYFFSILLVVLILHAIFWIAQKFYIRNLNYFNLNSDASDTRLNTTSSVNFSATIVHYFSCLSPSHHITTSSNRVAVVCGFILGIVCLLLFQFLSSAAVMQHAMGIRAAGGVREVVISNTAQHEPTGFNKDAGSLLTTPHCPQLKCLEIGTSACSHEKSNAFVTTASSSSECHSLLNLPENQSPLHQQSSYSPLKLYSIDCLDDNWMNSGKWSLRSEASPPAPPEWIKIDRWGMFGAQGRPDLDNQYIWNPPVECTGPNGKGSKGSFRRFNAEKFLKAIEGKTISFLGDSMNRQMFGMLTVLLNDHIIGNSLFYTRDAKFPNPVREYYFQHNVTMKNQWLMGHQGSQTLLMETFPTLWRSDLMVFNIGAFFDEGAESRLKETVQSFLEYADKHYKGSMLWREYSPTHFSTPDGEFDMLRRRDPLLNKCVPFDLQSAIAENPKLVDARYSNYRLKGPNEIMKRQGIPILPIFNVSVVVPEADVMHRGSGDCRHWYQPSAVLEHWCDVLYNMIVPLEFD